jgi:hypothetical protein
MNCQQCKKEIPHGQAVLVWEPDEMTRRFCALDCIRAWLGPDRPLSRRLENGKNGGSIPQHVVVEQLHKIADNLEKFEHLGLPTIIRGVLAGNL